MTEQITQRLAEFASEAKWETLPGDVRHQVLRALVNWAGVAIGGSRHPSIDVLVATMESVGTARDAVLLGRNERLGVPDAALVNCVSSAVYTFDDTHYASISHPGGPVLSALAAMADRRRCPGKSLLGAATVGVEIACRLGNMLIRTPAKGDVNLFMTSITGGIGAAVAVSNLIGLDSARTAAAIGIAAAQACGIREMHASMTSSFMCGHAARCGVMSALLAEGGFTASTRAIEGDKGFARVFSREPDFSRVAIGLGEDFELRTLAFKPYPCGVAAHAAIDAALELSGERGLDPESIASCEAVTNPVALELMWRRDPVDELEAQVSIYHWIAAALARGERGLPDDIPAQVADSAIAALRARIEVRTDPEMSADAAFLRLVLSDGSVVERRVAHARGSVGQPLSDDDLSQKFTSQVVPILGGAASDKALECCWSAERLDDASIMNSLLSNSIHIEQSEVRA